MSSVPNNRMRVECRDMAALHTSRRYAGLAALTTLVVTLWPFITFQQPKPPAIRQLVISMREAEAVPAEQPAAEERRLLAGEAPYAVPERSREETPAHTVSAPVMKERAPAESSPKPVTADKARPRKRRSATPQPLQVGSHAGESQVAAPQVTSMAGAELSAASKQAALRLLIQEIERRKRYPKQARRTGSRGTVTLAIRIGADGRVKECVLAKTCGIGTLDQETERLGRKLIGVATGAVGEAFTVQVPVRYALQESPE